MPHVQTLLPHGPYLIILQGYAREISKDGRRFRLYADENQSSIGDHGGGDAGQRGSPPAMAVDIFRTAGKVWGRCGSAVGFLIGHVLGRPLPWALTLNKP